MDKLSAIIITLNEEKNIERCLKSLQTVADEIIVVDSNSTDQTLEICKKYQAQIIQQQWLGYSEQKNLGNKAASHPYILSIDADEALSEELRQSILQIKKEGFTEAYQFNRLNNYCGKWIKHTSWYPDTKVRIWNKNEGKWEGDIHETVILDSNTSISHLKGNLLHYSFYTIEEHIAQSNKFSSIATNSRYAKGKKVSLLKITFAPLFKFFKEYFIKLGILDGIYGFTISKISAHETFLKYIKLYHKNHSK